MSSPSRSEPLAIDLDRPIPATNLLVISLIVVHLVSGGGAWWGRRRLDLLDVWLFSRPPGIRIAVGGQHARLVEDGALWRLATSVMLHVDALHLLLNTVALASLGRLLEPWIGGVRLWAWFALGGLGGSVLSQLAGVRQSDGASGGAFALLGAAIVLGWRWRERLGPEDRRLMGPVLWAFLGLNLIASLLVPAVDAAGHVGGLLVGLAVAWIPVHPAVRAAEILVIGGFIGACAYGWILG
ncbi:MAG TPA: rhomboid family intramembrane serine protease [Deltaproteobacteria bacterium]|nr:rhomboid family intramembrane serine protease [Deltaproteobacteria bacterium]